MTENNETLLNNHAPKLENWKARYWSIFFGQSISLIGSAMTQFVLVWWITDTTNSASALGLAGLSALLPMAILGPIGGTFADRYNRRIIMITADLISALCMAILILLFLTNNIQLWHLYVMMGIRSSMQAFQQPAASSSIAMLVPPEFIMRAAGLNQTMYGIMTVGAAPMGALAISIMPIGWALSIDVFTAILGIVPLLIYAIPQPKKPDGNTSLWEEFKQGVDTVWHNPILIRLYGIMTASIIAAMPLMTLVPLLIKEHFGGGAPEVAILESFGGAGMIFGGILVTMVAPKKRVLWVLGGFALANLTFALTAIVSPEMFWIGIAMWAIGSVAYIVGNAPFMALLQNNIPTHLQGRVISLLTTLMGLAAPVGLGIATILGKFVSVQMLFVILGIAGCLIIMAGFLSPIVRNADKNLNIN